ncbi:fringe glycosyltransferase [Cylas formicarius]|uniref:fringe glycosyltransferase n=1 Tax=Cylas formicarius TaxID=197179 RepID=UPI002958B647|nr:fringe glycosyltransferase [Cylas formicarius]
MSKEGETVVYSIDHSKMNLKHRKVLQTLSCAVLLAYTSLLVYQSFSRSGRGLSQISKKDNQILKKYNYERNLAQEQSLNELEGSYSSTEISSATATAKPPTTTLDDVFISVKTTRNYHGSRLPIILKTWFQLAKKQTWFFTDTEDQDFQQKTNGHMINTNCSSSHNRKALCCKMSVEFDTFLSTDKKWFCHFDDDNYVNVPRLVRFLGDYNPREDWYLGKPSIQAPLEIVSKDKKSQKVRFWFATGGAGFCLSRALALKMMPVASDGKFISTGEKIRLPDDVTMGYIIEHLLKKPLTVVDQFHSHLEPMKFIRRDMIEDQISFSYAKIKDEWNVVRIEGFDEKYDQNRFLSLHCFLFPQFNFCPTRRKR